MPLPLPSAIRVESLRDDVSYALPVRRLGALRWLGLFLIGFGMLFVSVPTSSLFGSLRDIVAGRADVGDWIFAVFLVPFVVGGLVPFGLGLLVLFGRCRVEWSQKRAATHRNCAGWRRNCERR